MKKMTAALFATLGALGILTIATPANAQQIDLGPACIDTSEPQVYAEPDPLEDFLVPACTEGQDGDALIPR